MENAPSADHDIFPNESEQHMLGYMIFEQDNKKIDPFPPPSVLSI